MFDQVSYLLSSFAFGSGWGGCCPGFSDFDGAFKCSDGEGVVEDGEDVAASSAEVEAEAAAAVAAAASGKCRRKEENWEECRDTKDGGKLGDVS